MIITIGQFKEVLGAGGSVIIDGSIFILSQLKELATEAAASKSIIIIKNIGSFSHEQLTSLATLAPGLIFFDFT
jgi:hypothetical protein